MRQRLRARALWRSQEIFIGPVEIAGRAQGLVSGLGACGLAAHVGLAAPHPFRYAPEAPSTNLLMAWQHVGQLRINTPRARVWRKISLRLLHGVLGWCVLASELRRSYAFVFLFGETITNTSLELRLLRLMRKRVVFIYVGSDARPRWMMRRPSQRSSRSATRSLAREQRVQAARLDRQERAATAVVSARTTAQLLRRPFVDSLEFGRPVPEVEAVPAPPTAQGRAVRLLHSPSSPSLKGTTYIERAILELRAEGLDLELICLTGQPHSRVLEELAECDFVVDQVFSDLPWSAFVGEAAAVGRPGVVAGYAAEWYRKHVPAERIPPSLYVLPRDLKSAIRSLAESPDLRQDLGERARAFATRNWTSRQVAERLIRLLHDDVPNCWLVDPAAQDYVLGSGVPAWEVQEQVRELVDAFGESALALPHRQHSDVLRELLGLDLRELGP